MSPKTITLALCALIASATLASASSNSFYLTGQQAGKSIVELGLVRSEGDGIVEIYDYKRGSVGALLGTRTVHAGANEDVRVPVGHNPQNDVFAILKVDGETVASQRIDIR